MRFLSRKLFAAGLAMGAITGLLVGLAIIDTGLLEVNKELLIIAIAAIAGLGGFAVNKQAQVDVAQAMMPSPMVNYAGSPIAEGGPDA